MTVQSDLVTTLYIINMTETPTLMTETPLPDSFFFNHFYETKTKQDLIMFYYAACFSPSKSTFIQAIKCNALTSWPGLTADLVDKYLPKKEANVMGRIKQKSKGTNFTQPKQLQTQAPPELIKQRTHQVFFKLLNFPTNSTPTKQAVSLWRIAEATSTWWSLMTLISIIY